MVVDDKARSRLGMAVFCFGFAVSFQLPSAVPGQSPFLLSIFDLVSFLLECLVLPPFFYSLD